MRGSGISRRTFLQAAAIGAVSVGAADALAACASSQTDAGGTSDATNADEAQASEYDHASLTTDSGVATGARIAHLNLESNAQLAETIPLETIELSGLLGGYSVSDVARTGDTTLSLTLVDSKTTPADTEDSALGIVRIGEGAFGDETIYGYGAVPVRAASPTIDPADGRWNEQTGLIYLPINLDIAEFAQQPQAADFALADSALAIVGVDYDAASIRVATLHITAPESGIEQTFEALDRTLTSDGVRIAGTITNCGDLVARSQDVLDGNGDASVTALSCLAADTDVIIDDIDVTADTPGDPNSDMTVHLNIQIQVTNGSIVLPTDNFEKAVDIDSIGDGIQLLDDTPIRIDDTHFYANLDMTRNDINMFTRDGEEADTDKLARDFAAVARAHVITISDGIIKNAWGIPQAGGTMRIYMTNEQLDEPQTVDEDASASIALQKAYADELVSDDSDIEKAREALDITEKILESAGDLTLGIAECAAGDVGQGVGEILSGAGGIFGLVDSCLGLSQGELVSLQEILGRLDNIDEELKNLESAVDRIEKKIDQIEKKLDYAIAIANASNLIAHATLLGRLLATYRDFMDGYVPGTRFDQMTDARKAELVQMIDALHNIESDNSFKAFADADELGRMIAPDGTDTSLVEKYFLCVDTRYNWEPECYVERQLFYAHVGFAFETLYMWAMLEKQYNFTNKIGSADAIVAECKQLADTCLSVNKMLIGDYDADHGYTSESTLHAATHARSDGKVLNLVNHRLYDQSAFIPSFFNDDRDAYCHGDPSDVKTFKYDGTLARGDLDLMVGNLANAGYTSLSAEFAAMGFNLDKQYYAEYDWESGRNSAVEDYDLPPRDMAFLVSDSKSETINNKASVQHTKAWYADYYSFDDNAVVQSAEIYVVDQKYHASDSHWHTKTSYADASIFR